MNLSKKSAPQLFIIHKSALLIRFLLIIHGVALAAILANTLTSLYKLLTVTALGLNLWIYLQREHYQFQPYQIRYSDDSGWTLILNNTEQSLTLLPSTLITSWFCILHFRTSTGGFQSFLIVNDALSAQDYRALVTKLKTTAGDASAGVQT